jgi:hypothetical protein
MALTRINNNSLSSVTAAGIPGHGSLTNFELWNLLDNVVDDQAPVTGWTRQSEASYGSSAITQSGGIFTLPSTGYWWITVSVFLRAVSTGTAELDIATTDDNSNYTVQARALHELSSTGGQGDATVSASYIFDVTDTSTHKFRTNFNETSTNTIIAGNTVGTTSMTIIRLGDT